MKKTAVVILNWNGKALLERFLPALTKNIPSSSAEIIIADNGSTDDSLHFLQEAYPELGLIRFDKNHGFAEGYNKALAMLDHEYVVLLNSDVEVSPGWLDTAVDYLDRNPEVSALQPKMLSQANKTLFEYAGACGGFMDYLAYPFCRGRIFSKVEPDLHQYEETVPVLWASGACLFIRLSVFKEAGGLDAYFFAHQEEIDLCWRLVSRGHRIVCLPSSVVYHVGGATLAMEHPHKTYLNFRNNLLMVYKNMPEKLLGKVLCIRWFLDYLAAFQFLLKGYPANARSVWKARQDFRKQKKCYGPVREKNLALQVSKDLPSLFLRKSLLLGFYLKGKKRFQEI